LKREDILKKLIDEDDNAEPGHIIFLLVVQQLCFSGVCDIVIYGKRKPFIWLTGKDEGAWLYRFRHESLAS
jgi:hypothetical protein